MPTLMNKREDRLAAANRRLANRIAALEAESAELLKLHASKNDRIVAFEEENAELRAQIDAQQAELDHKSTLMSNVATVSARIVAENTALTERVRELEARSADDDIVESYYRLPLSCRRYGR